MENIAALDELRVIQQDLLGTRQIFLRALQLQTVGFQFH